MSARIKNIEEVKIPGTYVLEQSEYIKETDSFALVLRHGISGARVLVFSNEDENKVFSVGFRTPPKDATGVPHIIEHTVLCGSKNFPAKDPFVELVKGSLNTYLNASTYPDKTLYPVASCNEKDFQNLMHVYMDAVFYPNIYEKEEIFKQEGWHYELTGKEDPITYNGVVFNEMKGAFSSDEGVLERFVMNSLFPDNTYGNESGGDPACIPDLTYEEYLNFHRSYYHPSNSYIYLYGNMDIEERLNWMDANYLKDFPAIPLDSAIENQKPFPAMKKCSKNYAVSQDADCTEKTYYAFAAAMDVTMDQEICRAFQLLSYVLVEMPGAPLKQALLDAGIGNDIDVDFCDILKQSYFSVATKNARAGKREEFYSILRSSLEKIVQEGIDRKTLEAAINGMEFREREADYGSFPKGLLYGIKTMKTWLYDDSHPFDSLCYEKYYKFLREKLNTGYYEELIQRYLLDNPHAVLVEMVPKPGLAAENEQKEKDRLAAYKFSLSDGEIEKLIRDTKALKEYQEAPTPKEELEKIPMLAREDISREVLPFFNQETSLHGIKTVYHEIPTNGIVYLRVFFDAAKLEEYMPQMSFLATLLGYMDTEERNYTEFDTETNFYTGGIVSDVNIYCKHQNPDDYTLNFEVRAKVLNGKTEEALKLMAEMMFQTLFEDEKHLKEVVAESRSRLKMRLMSSGHQAAASRATAYFSKSAWLNDASLGITYYQYLEQLDEHFEQEKESLKAGCRALLGQLFQKQGMLVSCTSDQEGIQAVENAMPIFLQKLQEFEDKSRETNLAILKRYPAVPEKKQEGFLTSAEIQYVALAGSFRQIENVNTGALQVVRHLLNYDYLWNEVRVKGGAYGVACKFNRDGEGFFTSYRDPNLSDTIQVYQGAADYLRNFDAEDREVLKTIIGTISGMDTPLTPAMKGRRSMMAYFSQTPLAVLQKEREQVLSCGCNDIREAAKVMEAVVSEGNLCVIGNERRLEEDKELFGELIPLS